MTNVDRWLLPDGIEEVLPPQARHIEHLRRDLLDLMDRWGYDLVMPPVLEYLDSLLTGTGKDLDLRTFKVTDQLSGRLMGLSADTTPQVARIDAHSLAPEGTGRYCYCRTVFHAKAGSLLASRTPTQIGAELFGQDGEQADIEMISLMLSTLSASGMQDIHLDLGSVGVYRELARLAGIQPDQQKELFELLKLKCASDVDHWADQVIRDDKLNQAFRLLGRMQGSPDELMSRIEQLEQLVPSTAAELERVCSVARHIAVRYPQVPVYLDLTELRGYQYHTGLVFAAYMPGYGDAIAQGGRYDESGQAFGRGRAATGFSADLRVIARRSGYVAGQRELVVAPEDSDPQLWTMIQALRADGKRVVVGGDAEELHADFYLNLVDGQWQLVGTSI